jgi:hypothetical protein
MIFNWAKAAAVEWDENENCVVQKMYEHFEIGSGINVSNRLNFFLNRSANKDSIY